ncbi:proteasome regulatory particle base subunit RPT6 [Sugiyamaella lignohabitans]|uniref:Proteasome regulatory particle base subunit RPT6 n=1 Tax=Sugiyamaella lignohabitans TaxID=796027 RepID=A0A167F849_9ASCO|nr:proteasome regulatory particle base subunit RPT6 [Sugiyamaella lignohabitans]ANB14938.1 proteasome regulatory particle base subunit RPT6 [Sugiyamaella lignohabitans]
MATAVAASSVPQPATSSNATGSTKLSGQKSNAESGVVPFFAQKIEETEFQINEKTQNLRRLEAQRNALNAKVRLLKEELQLLQEPGSYVGEVVKVMGKEKVLVKVHPEGKYVVDIASDIDIKKITPSLRVCLRSDSYQLHQILPNKVDPLVSLMMVEKVPDSTFDMVGGLDKQIKEIKEVIELPVKHPELFESLGIAQPKGVILYGPPGTGKTLLARAVAHHTECKFIRVSGSELVQKYIGEGSRMVRELFVMAREHAPSIIFMDEIDSIGSSRVEGSSGGDSEVQRTMLELLNQLDGFESSKDIKIIMATNRLDILDPALLRPGRIDRKIEFPPPTVEARTDILRIHSRSMNLTRGINLRKIAEKMNGCSGAEVKGVCTEADIGTPNPLALFITAAEEAPRGRFDVCLTETPFGDEAAVDKSSSIATIARRCRFDGRADAIGVELRDAPGAGEPRFLSDPDIPAVIAVEEAILELARAPLLPLVAPGPCVDSLPAGTDPCLVDGAESVLYEEYRPFDADGDAGARSPSSSSFLISSFSFLTCLEII